MKEEEPAETVPEAAEMPVDTVTGAMEEKPSEPAGEAAEEKNPPKEKPAGETTAAKTTAGETPPEETGSSHEREETIELPRIPMTLDSFLKR